MADIKPNGRPTVMTPEVIERLRQAYLLGSNDKEAYGYAGVSHETFYNYIEKHPEFREQINIWQDEPILKARKKIVDDIDKDTNTAKWYLERKRKSEFSTKIETEQTGLDPVGDILRAAGIIGGENANRSDDDNTEGSAQSKT